MNKVDEFMKYHEDQNNWASNEDGFNKMYDILDKYGTEDETVDIVFQRASEADQDRMLDLIRPQLELGQKGYAKRLYQEAVHNSRYHDMYNFGVIDAFEALSEEGYINIKDFEEYKRF